jgi:hypothetical protein
MKKESKPMNEFDKMIRLLDMAWALRSQIVPCLVGPPGIGKTAAVMQHAKNHGCGKVVKIVASRCVPSETVGMTMPDNERRSMDIYNSRQLSCLEDGDILFLDELLEADQFVLSTLLTVIESREMADGTPLPDVQIIAATNDTIPPEQLRGNIRQRFMFQRFEMDKLATRAYIQELTGMRLGDTILNKMTTTSGSDYNFLTPRTLTKLCLWMDSVDKSQVNELVTVINGMFNSNIGNHIAHARRDRDSKVMSPRDQVIKGIKAMIRDGDISMDDDFEDCTMAELLETLQGLDNWEEIRDKLSGMTIEESEEDDHASVSF